jgi:LysM repeat protein
MVTAVALRSTGLGPVRLTRRGRAVVLGLLVAPAALAIVLVSQPGQAADPAPLPTVVVQPGDTLWNIAGRVAPGRNPAAAVDDIRRLNHLQGYSLQAGQRLTLPRR